MAVRIIKKEVTIRLPFFLDAFSDAWHISKLIMIVLLAGSVISAMFFGPVVRLVWWQSIPAHFVILGLAWNMPFNVCYNHWFKLK